MGSEISVVVPFNAERYIRRCIEGLLAQDLPRERYELFMIDNNSSDDSDTIVEEYSGVQLLREPKQGAYAARNRGLAHARGSILVFTDPDCVPQRDWLRRITEPFSSPEIQIVMGRSLMGDDSLLLAIVQGYEKIRDEHILNGDDAELYYGRTNNMAVRQRVFSELGPFVELRRGGDTVLVRRVVDRYSCAAVRYQPEALVAHLQIDSLSVYYKKTFAYGRSSRRYGQEVRIHVMRRLDRWQLFRRSCRAHGYSFARSCILFLLLGVDGIAWSLGRWSTLAVRATDERSEA